MKLSYIASLAFALGTGSASAYAAEADLSPRVASVVHAVEEKYGVNAVVVLDEENAELLVVHEDEIVMKTPALYGKGKGGDETIDPSTTPVGVFNLKKYFAPKGYEGGTIFSFLDTDKAGYWIHSTWQGNPSQRRDQRLATPTPDDNAVSEGCVNISRNEYSVLTVWMDSHLQYYKGQAVPSYAPFVVVPKGQDTAQTLRTLGFTAPAPN